METVKQPLKSEASSRVTRLTEKYLENLATGGRTREDSIRPTSGGNDQQENDNTNNGVKEEEEEEREETESIYENVSLFSKKTLDPFGDDFEVALRGGIQTPVDRSSLSSLGSSAHLLPVPGSSPASTSYQAGTSPASTSYQAGTSPASTSYQAGHYSSPPVPGKRVARSVSQISRQSFESGCSDPTSRKKYSYDEVSICSNFNKPVIPELPKEKIYDIFSQISFTSPLKDIERSSPEPPTTDLASAEVQERNFNSLESNLSSINITRPTSHSGKSNSFAYEPYEDIDEIRLKLSEEKEEEDKTPPPLPPPRNSLNSLNSYSPLKSDNSSPGSKGNSPGSKEDFPDSKDSYNSRQENIYSECISDQTGGRLSPGQQETLLDRLMSNTSDQLSGCQGLVGNSRNSSSSSNSLEQPLSLDSSLGARPKNHKGTIDIRNTVYEWYEQAAKEVERDLSLDISLLEQNSETRKRVRPKANYEHISMAVTGKPVVEGREIIPQPTITLLRDFDPCFDPEEEDEATNSSTSSSDEDERSSSNPPGHALPPSGRTASPRAAAKKSVSAAGCEKQQQPQPAKKLLFSGESQKKITFGGSSGKNRPGGGYNGGEGPAKPPRNFDSATANVDRHAKGGGGGGIGGGAGAVVAATTRSDSTGAAKKSVSSFQFFGGNRHKGGAAAAAGGGGGGGGGSKTAGQCGGEDEEEGEAADGCGRLKATRSAADRVENHYVVFPGDGDGGGEDDNDGVYEEPPSSPPPPLPTSLPPSAEKPRQTLYENVWIEHTNSTNSGRPSPSPSPSPASRLPTLPPRIDKTRDANSNSPESVGSDRPRRKYSEGSDRLQYSEGSDRPRPSPVTTPHRKFSDASLTSWKNARGSKDSVDTLSSVSTTGSGGDTTSTTGSSQKMGGSGHPRLSKFPSTRSFTVSNLNAQLNKLPEIANSVKRRMSDLKPMGNTAKASGESEENDEDTVEDFDAVAAFRSMLFSEGGRQGNKNHTGAVHVYSRRKKIFQCKWCILGNGCIKWFNEETSMAIPKETIALSNIFSLTKRSEREIGPDQQDLHCFEIAALGSKGKFAVYKLGTPNPSDRDTWTDKIVQCLSYRLANFSMMNVRRIGWAYLKLGFAGEWSLSWLYLANRHLVYSTQDSSEFDRIDLKKTKDVFERKDSKNLCLPQGFTKHPVLVCDFNDRSLYLLLGSVKEVASWRTHIEEIAFINSNILGEQQVTHEEIPVIVDKCIKFVYSHGVMTEGIYRLAGVNTKINKLLSEFRSNAWSVQISREDYSEHDVANVLKRFVRQLNEPLLTDRLRADFIATAQLPVDTSSSSSSHSVEEKLTRYRDLLSRLPPVNYATVRKLLGHLHTVAEQREKNLMPVYNLAPLWGPNMLTVDTMPDAGGGSRPPQQLGLNTGETEVCADLISHYCHLFDVEPAELEKEKRLLEVLEKINFPTPGSIKRSGDIKMWCYLETRTGGKCISLSLRPSLTAGDAVAQAGREAGWPSGELASMLMHEVVLGEALERPVHPSEKILDLTLRWGKWEDDDRRNNYLLVKRNQFYAEALPCAVPPLSIFSELHFSDNKPKSKFTKHLFSVSNASITYYREDKQGASTEVSAWPVEDIIWYIGCGRKRGAPYNLNLTFISKSEGVPRTKEAPLFGRVLSFQSRELFVKWIAALLVAEYQGEMGTASSTLVQL